MNAVITETPIYWIKHRELIVDIFFEIHPISECHEKVLYQRLVESSYLARGDIKLLKSDGAIRAIKYKYDLYGDECEYIENTYQSTDEMLEEVIEEFVADMGGYQQVQA
jgi:hypothetical protein